MKSFSHCFEQQDIAIFKAMFLVNLHKDENKSEGVPLLQLLQKYVVWCTEENSQYENSEELYKNFQWVNEFPVSSCPEYGDYFLSPY